MTEGEALVGKRFVVPDIVATHFHLREGDVVADFGAGNGFFIKTLSEHVGASGTVHACEIQKSLVESIGDFVRRDGIQNVEVHWCDLEDTNGSKLQDDSLDAGIVVNCLFQFEKKDEAVIEFKRVLRGGGKLFVVDWSESFGGVGPQPDQVVSKDAARALFETHGFTLEHEFDAGDHHYGLAFRI